MDNLIYLEIGNMESLMNVLKEAKRNGLMKDISPEMVRNAFINKEFPIRFPVKLDVILQLAGNPILRKMFGKKVEETTLKMLKKAAETG